MTGVRTPLKVLAGAAAAVVASRVGAAAVIDREARGRLVGRWVRVNGRRMFTRVPRAAFRRAGPPVVLVHGLGISSRYMVPLAVRLLPDFRILAPDLPGFGRSDGPRQALTIRQLADALRGWLDVLDIARATFVGQSLGCQIIADLASREAERIDRLILVGPTVDPSARRLDRQVARLAVDAPRERASLLILVEDDWIRAGPVRLAATARYALADRIEEKLPRIAAPSLVVRGERDPMVSHEWAATVARLLPRGRLVEVPGAAHAVHYSAPDAFVAAVRPFLAADATGPRGHGGRAAPGSS